jgi:hypothetical protein
MGMLSLEINGSRLKDPPIDPSRIAQGLYPSGTLARTLRQRNLTKPGHSVAPTQGSGARLGLRLSIDDTLDLGPWLLLGLRSQPRLRCKETSPEPSRLEGLQTPRSGRGLAGQFRDRVMHGHDTRRQAFHVFKVLGRS